MFGFLRRKRRVDDSETLKVLKLLQGQRLIGVTYNRGEWQFHFDDWVVFVKDPFPSPIIGRISAE